MEDIQIYGSRPEPPEAIEFDEDQRLAEMILLPRQSAAQFEEAVDRPAKIRKNGESKTYNYQALTAMDWNSGASPLDAWLNQSAIPYTAPTVDLREEKGSSRKDSVAQEIEEIKVFRNVHMAIAPEPATGQHLLAIDAVAELEFNAQIYYRNIVDRYPDLPSYLALRLARANRDRAERLRQQKIRNKPRRYLRILMVKVILETQRRRHLRPWWVNSTQVYLTHRRDTNTKPVTSVLADPALYKHICTATLGKSVSKKAAASYRGFAKIISSLCLRNRRLWTSFLC